MIELETVFPPETGSLYDACEAEKDNIQSALDAFRDFLGSRNPHELRDLPLVDFCNLMTTAYLMVAYFFPTPVGREGQPVWSKDKREGYKEAIRDLIGHETQTIFWGIIEYEGLWEKIGLSPGISMNPLLDNLDNRDIRRRGKGRRT